MIYVMSDIHGNMQRFRSVTSKISLSEDDHLYILGDVIDRHESGLDLLREILRANNTTLLLGNHEHMMLNSVTPECEKLPWYRSSPDIEQYTWFCNGGRKTLAAYQSLSQTEQREIRDRLVNLPINVDVSVNGIAFKLVHAAPVELYRGRYGQSSSAYIDSTAFAVWHRFDDFSYIPKNYIMIYGHTPTSYYQNKKTLSIWHGDGVIGIDCGSGFGKRPTEYNPYQGRLAILRLDDMAEFYSDD